ncbi:hypothetical protein EG328_011727 [Venturia inaequalis]|uniref:Uncharacterized protein n=1 Tax=Venturia inaequalis TaxID=5025 RepID=A0A8H3V1N2_VENIN|nr:hypothetical protein EG328_011727 [Venturia inaequalis]RDI78311.1 hypothetical protein Vi05172_g11722 [Venturia inaequalis]
MDNAPPAAQSNNYDHLRRNTSQKTPNRELSTRRGTRTPNERISNGTVSTNMTDMSTSSGRESSGTAVTQPPAYSKKLVVVGDGGCGKTCLLISYAEGRFPEKYVPTVFENYITMTTVPGTTKDIELALWDTAGQEEYDRLRPLSYPETDLLFVCFAIDCPNSLENVMDKWYPEVLHFCPTTPIILCGLKSDLRNKKTCIDLLKTQGLTPVTPGQGQAVANKMGARYMECSSKENIGVEEIFDTAITMAVKAGEEAAFDNRLGVSREKESRGGSGLSGNSSEKRKKKKNKGCKFL